MTFEIPQSKAAASENQFSFRLPGDDRTYTVPLIRYLPVGLVERLSDKGSTTDLSAVLDAFGEGDAAAAVRKLDAEQFDALMRAWAEASGVELGEPSASSSS